MAKTNVMFKHKTKKFQVDCHLLFFGYFKDLKESGCKPYVYKTGNCLKAVARAGDRVLKTFLLQIMLLHHPLANVLDRRTSITQKLFMKVFQAVLVAQLLFIIVTKRQDGC